MGALAELRAGTRGQDADARDVVVRSVLHCPAGTAVREIAGSPPRQGVPNVVRKCHRGEESGSDTNRDCGEEMMVGIKQSELKAALVFHLNV